MTSGVGKPNPNSSGSTWKGGSNAGAGPTKDGAKQQHAGGRPLDLGTASGQTEAVQGLKNKMNNAENSRNTANSRNAVSSTVLCIDALQTKAELLSFTAFKETAESGKVYALEEQLSKMREAVEELEHITAEASNAKAIREKEYTQVKTGLKMSTANGVTMADSLDATNCYDVAVWMSNVDLMKNNMPPELLEKFARQYDEEFTAVGKGGKTAKSSPSPAGTRTSAKAKEDAVDAMVEEYCTRAASWSPFEKAQDLLSRGENSARLTAFIENKEKQEANKVSGLVSKANKVIKEWPAAVRRVYLSSIGALHTSAQEVLGVRTFGQLTRDVNAIQQSVATPTDFALDDHAEIQKYKEVVHVLNAISTSHKGDTVTAAARARHDHQKNAASIKLGVDPRPVKAKLETTRVALEQIMAKAKDTAALNELLDLLMRIERSEANAALYAFHQQFDVMHVSAVSKATVNALWDSLQATYTAQGAMSRSQPAAKTTTAANAVSTGNPAGGGRGGPPAGGNQKRGPPQKGGPPLCWNCNEPHLKKDCPHDKVAEEAVAAAVKKNKAALAAQAARQGPPDDMRMPAKISAVFVGSATAQSDDGMSVTSSEDGEDDDVVCGLCAAGAAPAGAREIAYLAAQMEDLQAEVNRMQATAVATARDLSEGNRGKPVHARGGASTLSSVPDRALMDTGTPVCLTSGALENRVPHHKPLSGFNGQPSVSEYKGDAVRNMLCARTKATRSIILPFWHVADARTELVTPKTFAQCGHRFVMDPEGTRVEFSDGQTIWLEDDCSVLWADASVGQVQTPTEKKKKNRKKKSAHPNGQ